MRPLVSMRAALGDPDLFGRVFAGESWSAWRVLLMAADSLVHVLRRAPRVRKPEMDARAPARAYCGRLAASLALRAPPERDDGLDDAGPVRGAERRPFPIAVLYAITAMFVRFRQQGGRLQASLIRTSRVAGNVRARFGEGVEIRIARRDHQVAVEDLVGMRAQRRDDRRPERYVGYEMPVHRVEMNPVGARGGDGAHLLAEPGEVRGQNRRRDDHRLRQARFSLCRNTRLWRMSSASMVISLSRLMC